MTTPTDYPFAEIADAIPELIAKGFRVHQKFTCDACGQRLTMDEPNKLFKTGTCDKCWHITDIEKRGCNYLLLASLST